MGDESNPGREGEEGRPTPALAEASPANRLGAGFRERIAESIDSTGKALAVLAGFGAFFIAAGYFVEWQRLRQGRLPSEQILPLVPKDQIAAAGARELAISFLFVGLSLALLGFVLVRLGRWAQGRPGRVSRALDGVLSRYIAVATAIAGGVTLLIVPFTGTGIIVATIVTGLVLYGLLLVRRFLDAGDHARFPLWRLVVAIGIAAIVLAGARQFEFGEPRPDALVCLTDGTAFEGDYIASDSEKILLRKRPLSPAQVMRRERAETELRRTKRELRELQDGLIKAGRGGLETVARRERALGHRLPRVSEEAEEARSLGPRRRDGLTCAGGNAEEALKSRWRQRKAKRPELIVVPRSAVEEILLARSKRVLPYHTSLLDRVLSLIPGLSELELSCIPPECRVGGDTRIGPSTYL